MRWPYRRAARLVHRWGGLLAGALFVIIGLTGATLVFRREIDRALHPELLRVRVADTPSAANSLAQAFAAAQRYRPDAVFTTVRMPREPDGSVEFWYGADPVRAVFVDPWRAAVLGERAEDAHLMGWLYLMHSHLLAGERGHQVIGVAGLLLLAVGVSGLVLWWPRTNPTLTWHSVTRIRRDLGAARARYDLHRVVGFWSSALLVLAGFTGASLVFHEAFETGLATAFRDTRTVPAAPAEVPIGRSRLSLDSLLALSRQRQPGGAVSYVLLPTSPGAPLTVRRQMPGEQHPNGRSFVTIDPYTGAVLAEWDARRAPLGARAYYALYPLHIGRTGGPVGRGLLVLAGLAPAILFVSGVLIWRERSRGAGRSTRRRSLRRPRDRARRLQAA